MCLFATRYMFFVYKKTIFWPEAQFSQQMLSQEAEIFLRISYIFTENKYKYMILGSENMFQKVWGGEIHGLEGMRR